MSRVSLDRTERCVSFFVRPVEFLSSSAVVTSTTFFTIQVEREISSAMLDRSFAEKLAVEKGRQMLRSSESKLDEDGIETNSVQVLRAPSLAAPMMLSLAPKKTAARVSHALGVSEAKNSEAELLERQTTAANSETPSDALIDIDYERTVSKRPSTYTSSSQEIEAMQDSMSALFAIQDQNQTRLEASISTIRETHEARFGELDTKISTFMTKQMDVIEQMSSHLSRLEQMMTGATTAGPDTHRQLPSSSP